MENLNNHFEDCRKISERIVQEFQKINMDSKQRLQEINRRLEIMANNSLKEIPNEEAIVTAGNDAIQTSNLEKDIQDFMKNLDVSAINEETIAKIDAEYQDQMEQKMSDKEVSRFVDEVHNDPKEMNVQQEPKETKEIVSNVMLNEKIIQLCQEKSVKPGVKVKNKQKTRKMKENNVKKNILKFAGACVVLSGVLTVGATYADDIYANHL